MIQLELHLAVYIQLERVAIKTPMPMPNIPVRGELLQPYRDLIKARRVLHWKDMHNRSPYSFAGGSPKENPMFSRSSSMTRPYLKSVSMISVDALKGVDILQQ